MNHLTQISPLLPQTCPVHNSTTPHRASPSLVQFPLQISLDRQSFTPLLSRIPYSILVPFVDFPRHDIPLLHLFPTPHSILLARSPRIHASASCYSSGLDPSFLAFSFFSPSRKTFLNSYQSAPPTRSCLFFLPSQSNLSLSTRFSFPTRLKALLQSLHCTKFSSCATSFFSSSNLTLFFSCPVALFLFFLHLSKLRLQSILFPSCIKFLAPRRTLHSYAQLSHYLANSSLPYTSLDKLVYLPCRPPTRVMQSVWPHAEDATMRAR